MLNKIISFSLRNRLTILIVSILLLFSGVYVLFKTEVDIFPDLNAPTVVVMTEATGLAPEEVERLVSYPIETELNGATGVRRVRSSSTTGFSVVWIEFDWGTDIYRARQIVSEKLAGISETLPPGANNPTLGPQSSILGEIYIIGLTADSTSLADLRSIADKSIRPRLLSLGGVSQVTVIGGDIKEYQIQLKPERMKNFNISLDEVTAAVEMINNNASGGVMYEYGNEYLIKADVSTTSLEEIGQSVVRSDESGIVLLSDIADVKIGSKQPKLGLASVEAKPGVILTITKQPAVGTINLTEDIDEALADISKTIPSDVKVSTDIFRQSEFIGNSISNLQSSLLEGALFVVIILFFFLMNVRTTIISLVALPLSIIVTVLVMHFMGYTINTMSLGGIAIAIGSLVDDAIVDVENVYKRLKENRKLPKESRRTVLDVVFHASAEVRLPILNSSLIIVASFLPLFFLTGIEGKMLIPLGISFIISLAASTVVALTVTPVLCSFLLGGKKNDDKEPKEPWITAKMHKGYSKSLTWAMGHKKIVLSVIGALFIVSICFIPTLGRSFLPSFNEGSFTINVSTLPGISLAESNEVGKEAEKIILSVPEIKTVARKTGRAELDEHSLGVNTSEIEAPYVLADRPKSEVANELRKKLGELPGVNVEIGQPISHRIDAMLSGAKAQIAIKIFGSDLNDLYEIGSNVKKTLSTIPGLVDINIEQQIERPQIDIRPRRAMMARYGVTMSEFREFVETALAGKTVSQVYENGFPYDLTIRATDLDKITMDELANMLISTNQGNVPLSSIADVVSASGPNTINRENVKRRIMVSANVEGRDLRGAVNEIQAQIDKKITLPENYYIEYGGQFESEESASRTLMLATGLALLIIFILLYQEFKCLSETIIILINMPLAVIGGVLILVISGGELNIPAIIGFIALIGIATRNGMLLISRYNHLEDEGVTIKERIRIGSHDRLTPIVMTALTSALAMIPLALRGSEPGNEIQSPMAVVILGGLISSTILNVYVVPILYELASKKQNKKKQSR
jgi:CzcA family heavy metal efflux pump